MEIYLLNTETNELIQTFRDVKSWTSNSVTYLNGGYLGKVYCNENEYFTDRIPVEVLDE